MEKDSESHQGSGEGRCLVSQALGRVCGGGVGGVLVAWRASPCPGSTLGVGVGCSQGTCGWEIGFWVFEVTGKQLELPGKPGTNLISQGFMVYSIS